MADPVQMTSAEYAARYGAPPPSASPVIMTSQQYQERYGTSPDWSLAGSIKQYGAGAVEGITGLAGLLAGASKAIFNPYEVQYNYDPSTKAVSPSIGSSVLSPTQDLKQVTDAVLPNADPQYRYSRTLGQFTGPGALAKGLKLAGAGVGPLVEALTGVGLKDQIVNATAGLGAQGAEDVTGDSKIAPILGALGGAASSSVLADALSGLKGLWSGPSSEAIRGSAAKALNEISGLSPEQLSIAVKASQADELSRLATTAELTDNAAMAQLEKNLAGTGERATKYSILSKAREDTRDSILDAMSQTKAVNREKLGSDLMNQAVSVSSQMDKSARKLWQELPRDIPIDVTKGQKSLRNLLATRQGGLESGSKVKELVGQFLDVEDLPIKTSGMLQDIRSDALSLSRDANLRPFESRTLERLESLIDDSMKKGLKGKNYNLWKSAREATATSKQTFARGTPGGSLTEITARPSNALSNAIKGDTKSIKELKAAIKSDPLLIEDVKRGVLDMIPRDAQGTLTPAGMRKFIMANEGSLKELFGGEHYGAMRKISADLQRQARLDKIATLASRGNSSTAQRTTTAATIAETILGSMTPGSTTIAKIADELRQAGNLKTRGAIEDLLFKAALEPSFALELSKAPTTTRVLTNLEKLKSTLVRAGESASRGAALEIARPSGSQSLGEQQKSRAIINSAQSQSQGQPILNQLPSTNQGSPSRSSGVLDQTSFSKTTPGAVATQSAKLPISYTPQKIKEITKDLPPIVKAIVWQESRFNPKAKSLKGASGLMQLMPETQKAFGVTDPFDPEQNISAGIQLLQEEIKRFGGDPRLALAAYNAGSPAVNRAIKKAGSKKWSDVSRYLPKETRDYVPSVLKKYREFARA